MHLNLHLFVFSAFKLKFFEIDYYSHFSLFSPKRLIRSWFIFLTIFIYRFLSSINFCYVHFTFFFLPHLPFRLTCTFYLSVNLLSVRSDQRWSEDYQTPNQIPYIKLEIIEDCFFCVLICAKRNIYISHSPSLYIESRFRYFTGIPDVCYYIFFLNKLYCRYIL